MKTLLVPTFNYEKKKGYIFNRYEEVKIKNEPNTKDYNKVVSRLPGLACGYCSAIYTIVKTRKPIAVTSFYDIRQHGVNQLKGYFISVL